MGAPSQSLGRAICFKSSRRCAPFRAFRAYPSRKQPLEVV
jgi:hypothetical protein